MRILLVNKFHYLKGGSEKYYFELGKLLKEHGNEIAYFSMKDEKNIKTGDKEYFVEPIDLNNGSKLKALDVIYSKANYKKMCEAIEDFKPDIIHLNNFQRQLSASVVKAANDKKIPVIFTAHDMQAVCPNKDMLYKNEICEDCIKYGYKSCIKKICIKESKLKSLLGVIEAHYYKSHKVYKNIDCILSPSEFIKKQIIKGKVNYKRIEVIHNFVCKTDIDNSYDKGYIFYFGRLSKEKGIFNVIKAIKDHGDIKLYIAGDGPEREKIEKYIKDNNLNERVKLLGYLKQDEIRKYISESKIVIVPSIWYENCPYSILETMEIGKPIIASKIGGIPELIEDGKNGFLYDYNDIEQLKEKIVELYYNDGLVNEMSNYSKKLFDEKYSENKYFEKIMNLYREVIGEKKNV